MPRFWTGGIPLLPSEPGGEPASAAPGGGRSSPCFPLSHPSIEMLRCQDAKLQDLKPALCLPRRPTEGECHLQVEDGPLDSGHHHPGLSGRDPPFRWRANSTRNVLSCWALARGALLTDISRAAGLATPNTFARFYSLRVEPVSSCVLTSNG